MEIRSIGLPNLPLLQERFWNLIKEEFSNKEIPDFSIYVFPEIWGSTALGFDGFGGSAMTKAYTTVIKEETKNIAGVFFGERLAYLIYNPNDVFYEDLYSRNMSSVKDSIKYSDRSC